MNADAKMGGDVEKVANSSEKRAPSKFDDISKANGVGQNGSDEECVPDFKVAPALDAYGNEEGAEVQCESLQS